MRISLYVGTHAAGPPHAPTRTPEANPAHPETHPARPARAAHGKQGARGAHGPLVARQPCTPYAPRITTTGYGTGHRTALGPGAGRP